MYRKLLFSGHITAYMLIYSPHLDIENSPEYTGAVRRFEWGTVKYYLIVAFTCKGLFDMSLNHFRDVTKLVTVKYYLIVAFTCKGLLDMSLP